MAAFDVVGLSNCLRTIEHYIEEAEEFGRRPVDRYIARTGKRLLHLTRDALTDAGQREALARTLDELATVYASAKTAVVTRNVDALDAMFLLPVASAEPTVEDRAGAEIDMVRGVLHMRYLRGVSCALSHR